MAWRDCDEDTQQIRRPHVIARAVNVRPAPAKNPPIEARPTCKLAADEIMGLIADHRRHSPSDLHVTVEFTSEVPTEPALRRGNRLAHTLKRTPIDGVPVAPIARVQLVQRAMPMPEAIDFAGGSAPGLVPPPFEIEDEPATMPAATAVMSAERIAEIASSAESTLMVDPLPDPAITIRSPRRSPSALRDLSLGLAIGVTMIALAAAVIGML